MTGFVAAFTLKTESNLSLTAKELPEGITICSPMMVAGIAHIDGVLKQATEYWNRKIQLARNKSIDLLMRVTCQGQIAKAVELSKISRTNEVAVFGLAAKDSEIEEALASLETKFGAARSDDLLVLNEEKERYLKQVHSLPESLSTDQIVPILLERSVLLVFSK